MIVMKFGGTSLESAEALRRIAGIVNARRVESPFVVFPPWARPQTN